MLSKSSKSSRSKPAHLIQDSDFSDDAAVLLGAHAGDGGQAHRDGAPLAAFEGPEVEAGQVEADVPVLGVEVLAGVFLALKNVSIDFLLIRVIR